MFSLFLREKWGGGDEETTNVITLEFTRVVLAIGVFAIGVELPKAYMIHHWKSLFFLLVPVMTWGWFVSAGLIYGLIPGLNFLSSLAVAACLTPTDPILAAAVVGGKWADKHVPAHIRHLLAAESGCNDGAAYPFLFIALYLMLDSPDVGIAVRDWFVRLWLYQVILGIVIGAALGFGFRHLMKFCQRHNLIDRQSYVAQYLSLAMLTIGVTVLVGSDDLLAAFSCGTAFAWDGFFNRQTEEAVFSSVIDLLFNIAAFIYVGAWMPFSDFQNAATTLSVWRLIVIAILIFLLRRLPVMIALYTWIPDIKTLREAIFSGHFGPIGIGAVFISTLANEVIHKDDRLHSEQINLLADTIQPIVAFMVLCSIVLHGLSIPSFSLGRRVHSVSRSVSRTWSRHAPPDWTNQAPLVERGADLPINRDSDMERGELGGSEDKVPKEPESRLSISETRTPSVTLGGRGDDGLSIQEKAELSYAQPDTLRDIGATETEWLEPHRRVIERRASPGEDVVVEVIPEEGRQSLSAQIKQSLGLLHRLKQTAQHLEDQTGETVKDKLEEIELNVKDVLESHHDGHISDTGLPGVHNDDDGTWASASEESGGENDTNSGPSKKRSQGRSTRLQRAGSSRRGRRRPSIRRAKVPPAIELQVHSPSSGSGSESPTSQMPPEDSDRGRSYPTHARFATDVAQPHQSNAVASGSRPSTSESTWTSSDRRHRHRRPGTEESSILRPGTADSSTMRPGTGDGSVRNPRISQMRLLHSSPPTREVSPSRSVRFLDGRGEDNLEVRNKVSFDLGKSPQSGRD
ncbi:hypothetical protein H0H87_004554 [Tephrocybe sp. NHM501043]|nr:hypothetical protein H0H87_004554 [Tephrocybe sp. NHM501043]